MKRNYKDTRSRMVIWALLTLGFTLPAQLKAQSGACAFFDEDEEEIPGFYIKPLTSAKSFADPGLPLTGERTLKVNTTEGSWLSLDVSPDGKSIIFAMLGDIYRIPITGGTAEQLTSGMALDTQPRYSPDGQWIAFISDRDGAENAWILNIASKQLKQITKSRDEYYQAAEWTPDGKYLVVSKGVGTPRMHLFHIDGGSGVELTAKLPPDLKAIEPAFGKDGSQVWFSRRKGMWDYNAQLPQYQLAVFNRKTGEVEAKSTRYGSAFTPTLSPDGVWLVYGTRYNAESGLVLQKLATGEERWLAYPVQHDEQEALASMGVLPAMSFTPDSKNLIASYGGKIYSIPVAGGTAKEIPFVVNTEMKIGPKLSFKYPIKDDQTSTATQVRDLVMSPNGKQAAFTALDRLFVMDYPNGTPRRLTSMDVTEAQPAWSPDGKSLVFVTWDEKNGGLYKVAAAGGKPVKLSAENALYQEPVWSPDGSKIVFIQGLSAGMRSGASNRSVARQSLSWMPATGGPSTFIAKAEGSRPHFKNGDNHIYMFNAMDGLTVMDWDGKNKRGLVKLTGVTTYDFSNTNGGQFLYFRRTGSPVSIIKSPVGDKALALIANDVFIVTLPEVGAETPVISVADVTKSQFPSWKITEIGAEFPSWGADGKTVYWSLGHSVFAYNTDSVGKASYKPAESKINVNFKNDIPQGTILLKGARIITMVADEVIDNGDILVENNRITAVGASGSLTVPKNAQVIDVAGKTITPGFFDVHAHLGGGRGLHGLQPASYAANLAYGVTTTRDPQPGTTDVLTLSDMVNSGKVLGPRIYSTGPGVAYWAYNIRNLDHARSILKQYSEYFNTKTIKMYAVGNRQQRQWIIMAAKEQNLMPTTEGNLDMKLNLTEVLDGYPGHEHSYPTFPLYGDVTNFIAQSGIAFTSTFLVDYNGPNGENYYYTHEDVLNDKKINYFTGKDDIDRRARRRNNWFAEEEYVFKRQAKIVDDIMKKGGLPAVGAHGQFQGLGYHWELWSIQSGGMSNLNALKVATINGAKAIGLDGDLGSVEKGKLADLVIMEKNPLENIRNTNTIKYVMRNGRLYEANTLNEVAPLKRKAPLFNWQDEGPVNVPGIK